MNFHAGLTDCGDGFDRLGPGCRDCLLLIVWLVGWWPMVIGCDGRISTAKLASESFSDSVIAIAVAGDLPTAGVLFTIGLSSSSSSLMIIRLRAEETGLVMASSLDS